MELSIKKDIQFFHRKRKFWDWAMCIKYHDVPFKIADGISDWRWRVAQLGIRGTMLFSMFPKIFSGIMLIAFTSVFFSPFIGILALIYTTLLYIPYHYVDECYLLKNFINSFPTRSVIIGEDGKLMNIDFPTLVLAEFRDGRIEHGNAVLDKYLMKYDNDWMEFLFMDKNGYILVRWEGKEGIKGIHRPTDEEANGFLAGHGRAVIGKTS